MSRTTSVLAFSVAVSSIAVFTACGSLGGPSVGEQCQKLVTTTNAGMKKVQAIDSKDPGKEAELTATALDGLIKDVDGVGVKDEGLKKLVDQYEATLKSAAGTNRDLAAMMKSLDAKSGDPTAGLDKKMDEIEKKVDKFVKDEDTIVDKINDYCKDK